MIFASSWDDGYPADERLADLLSKFGIAGTFFIPKENHEGRTVLSRGAIAHLGMKYEIGGHTLNHVYLTKVPLGHARMQIIDGKAWLEDTLGKPVQGFCYPGGKYNRDITMIVQEAGFTYARTVENLCISLSQHMFRMPTTIQFFPHRSSVLLRNFLKHPVKTGKIGLLLDILLEENFHRRLELILEYVRERSAVLHLWGHSWELDKFGLWDELEFFLGEVQKLGVRSLTLSELAGIVRMERVAG